MCLSTIVSQSSLLQCCAVNNINNIAVRQGLYKHMIEVRRQSQHPQGKSLVTIVSVRQDKRYACRCSFLQIYNEAITDLLAPGAGSLQLREDTRRGSYVEGLSEHVVLNGL